MPWRQPSPCEAGEDTAARKVSGCPGLCCLNLSHHLRNAAAFLPSRPLLPRDLHREDLYSSLSSAQGTYEFQVTRTEKADVAGGKTGPWLPPWHMGEQTQPRDSFEPAWCRCLSDSEILSENFRPQVLSNTAARCSRFCGSDFKMWYLQPSANQVTTAWKGSGGRGTRTSLVQTSALSEVTSPPSPVVATLGSRTSHLGFLWERCTEPLCEMSLHKDAASARVVC